MDYPKFEKVNDTVVRIISEKIDEIPLKDLINNLEQLKQKREQLNQVITNIEQVIKGAQELGITSEEKK